MLAAFPARAVFLQRGTITRFRHSPLSSPPMKIGSMDAEKLHAFFRALNAHHVEYVVVGAVALSANGIVRSTNDADVFVRPTDENCARLRSALRDVWDDEHIAEVDFADASDVLSSITYVPPDGSLSLDLLAQLGEAWRFEDLEAHWVDFAGTPVHAATPRTLYRMKKDTVRLQDQADAAALRDKFGEEVD